MLILAEEDGGPAPGASRRLPPGFSRLYGSTQKGRLLESVPLGVTTWTVPVVAPAGIVVEMAVPVELTVKTAGAPLNVTLDAPVRLVPSIMTAAPVLPMVSSVLTNGPRPT